MITVFLDSDEISILDRQDPRTASNGGWQQLQVNLQMKVQRPSGRLNLSDSDLEKIPRYAFDYKNGGWENRLMRIFQRSLGRNLGRDF